ncbi:MAG: M14 family metallopeptidase [Aridibacter sp.]
MKKKSFFTHLHICGILLLLTFSVFSQNSVPEPKNILGFTPGDDYKLASWTSIVEYFQKLDAASDRVMFKEIGKTTEGKPFTYAVISSPENLKKLDYYKKINDQLADPRLIKRNDKIAEKLVKKGKTFVLITHGIHSTEVGSTLSSMLIAHKLASSNDKEIKKILDETIIIIVPSLNPDGVDIVKNWYDKTLGTKFEGTSPPELYQKYVGHDNNRDWYAFTQVETQLTVDKIHNVFHPQIVHDIHQQGSNGARYFVPPYLNPVEPNVPQEIIEGYTEIGNYIAKQMREDGLKGITTGSTYDAWTPARAYSHYHGGVRILSETASANLASPITVEEDKLTSRRGFDVTKESANYAPLWKGGKWGMRDITNYMTTGAFHLMTHAAENREAWLKRFYKIGKDATRPHKDGEVFAYVIDTSQKDYNPILVFSLLTAGVDVINAVPFKVNGKTYEDTAVIVLNQPYGDFAKVMIEPQEYPNLRDDEGNPISPYDVTAHSLALLTGVKVKKIYEKFPIPKESVKTSPIMPIGNANHNNPAKENNLKHEYESKPSIYHSNIPSMDEGWTRWIFDDRKYSQIFVSYVPLVKIPSKNLIFNKNIIDESFRNKTNSIIFPDQSPKQILEGYKEGSMPKEYTGGLGKEGVEKLKYFVKDGGTLVFLNRSSDFAIEQFDLPVKNIAKDWKEKDFYIPGSILRTELDTKHPIAKGMPEQSIAWFEDSPVFEVTDNSRVKVIAKYPEKADEILLSGWALGKEKIAGKAALVEVPMGKGKIILFGFRPQYRGQSLATFPLLFNSIAR